MREKFEQLHKQGVRLAIISNQSKIGKQKNDSDMERERQVVREKVDAITSALGVPVDFMCSTHNDLCRKPMTGMWDILRNAVFPDTSVEQVTHLIVFAYYYPLLSPLDPFDLPPCVYHSVLALSNSPLLSQSNPCCIYLMYLSL